MNSCRIHPALHTGALGVEQDVGRILPGSDRIIDRDALIQDERCISESAEEE
jgi:hypothetical protein